MKSKVTFDVRLDEETLKKLIFVANAEGRSLNNHILSLVRTNIAYYERIHAKISQKDIENIEIPENDAE